MPPTPEPALEDDQAEVVRLEQAVAAGHATEEEAELLEELLAQVADGDEVPDESDGIDQGPTAVEGSLE